MQIAGRPAPSCAPRMPQIKATPQRYGCAFSSGNARLRLPHTLLAQRHHGCDSIARRLPPSPDHFRARVHAGAFTRVSAQCNRLAVLVIAIGISLVNRTPSARGSTHATKSRLRRLSSQPFAIGPLHAAPITAIYHRRRHLHRLFLKKVAPPEMVE